MSVIEIFKVVYAFNIKTIKEKYISVLIFLLVMVLMFTLEDYRSSSETQNVILRTIPEAWLAFIWHRYYLVSKNLDLSGMPIKANKKEKKTVGELFLKFFIRSLIFVGLVYLAFIVVILFVAVSLAGNSDNIIISYGFFAIAGILFLLPVCRLLPFFPALAVGKQKSFGEIWLITNGKTIQIFLAFLATYIPVLVLAVGLFFLFEALQFSDYEMWSIKQFTLNFWAAFTSLLFLVMGVSTNSEIYRQLTGFKPPKK